MAGKLNGYTIELVGAHQSRRLQAMQKMQSAAGGRGRGANGMPTQAQIQAMQVGIDSKQNFGMFLIFFDSQRAMPPGMLQQVQRQLRSGGGMQEMMKAMMQGQGDQFDMEEMQSKQILLWNELKFAYFIQE